MLAAPTAPPFTPPCHPARPDARLPGPNAGEVEAGVLYRSGRPGAKDWQRWKDRGLVTVINLAAEIDERDSAEHVGLRYFALMWEDEAAPTERGIEEFRQVATDRANWPALVHCAGGEHRTGTAIACWRIGWDAWDLHSALREARSFDIWHGPISPAVVRWWEGGPLARKQMEFMRKWWPKQMQGGWRSKE